MKNKKLIIFDIDGTLIRSLTQEETLQRFRYAVDKIFHKDIGEITRERWMERDYNGKGDRHILWSLVSEIGISRDAFLDHLGAITSATIDFLDILAKDKPLYAAIPEAKKLVEYVIKQDYLESGVLTGNLTDAGIWKLKHAGYDEFAFGVYGSEADAREDLARLLLVKAQKYFEWKPKPEDIIIIGDTIYDIRCARVIGAHVIAVAGGWEVDRQRLAVEGADLLVDTLADPRVFDLLKIQ